MATEQPESVIARLMGLNEPPSYQKPSHSQRKVLSDSYIQKAASVGIRHGSPISTRSSCTKYGESLHKLKVLPGVQVSKNIYDIALETSEKHGQFSILSSVFEPNSAKAAYNFVDFKLDLHSKSGSEKSRESLTPESGKLHNVLAYKASHKYTYSSCNGTMNKISQQKKCRHNFRDVWRGHARDDMIFLANRKLMTWNLNPRLGINGLNLKQDPSFWRDNAKKQKIFQKHILNPSVGRGFEQLQFSPGMKVRMSQSSEIYESQRSCLPFFFSDYSKPEAYVEGNPDETVERCIETEVSASVLTSSNSDGASKYEIDGTLSNEEASDIACSTISREQQPEPIHDNLSMEDGHCCLQDFFSEEESYNEFSEKDYTYLNCSRLNPPVFQDYSKGTNQTDPDSDMAVFGSQKPSISECFDILGLPLRLKDFDLESDETYSEGSVMVVSGDEESVEGFSDDRKIQKWSEDSESRKFSYMVDALDEAGLHSTKSFMDLKKCDYLENPISNSVFESLEKKYGKQTITAKSERRLLFDRINSGLIDTINLVNDYETCIRRRFNEAWRRDNVEDALWMLLMNEEKDERRDLSEKALGRGKWLDLEEDTGIICRELESFLFEELVIELASL